MITFDQIDPSSVKDTLDKLEFCDLGFAYHKNTLYYFRVAAKRKLEEFRKDNPTHPEIPNQDKHIAALIRTEQWLNRLQDDYNATQKSAWKDHMANLKLENELERRKKYITRLEQELKTLKTNLADDIK